ncbi:MAG: tetratricopeptide repeat protein [Cyanobacteriota bacterium]|nr:tetratricopeptide repeat protein [Cyanobacteriota bacterium]
MNETLPTVYLAVLLALLSLTALFVFQQIFKVRRTEGRLSKLESKLKKEKGTSQEYYELGGMYLDKKMFVQASKLFEKALKTGDEVEAENKALIYNGLGYSYFANEQCDLAIRQYKEALQCNPEYIVALNNLGFAYERKKLTSQALEVYEETLKLDPKNSVAKRRAESLRKRLAPT